MCVLKLERGNESGEDESLGLAGASVLRVSQEPGCIADRKWNGKHVAVFHHGFTRSKDLTRLYAITLGWPDGGQLTIKTLGTDTKTATGDIKNIALLGSNKKVKWTRDGAGLTVTLPEKPAGNDIAYALRIEVEGKLDMERS